jgi:hypothetical protein
VRSIVHAPGLTSLLAPPTPPAASRATACAPTGDRPHSSASAPSPSCRRSRTSPRELEVAADRRQTVYEERATLAAVTEGPSHRFARSRDILRAATSASERSPVPHGPVGWHFRCSEACLREDLLLDKGKPAARQGRKVTGQASSLTAGLPKKDVPVAPRSMVGLPARRPPCMGRTFGLPPLA